MKNPLSRPRKRRNRNKNPRRTMRKLGSVEYLETRKLLTAAGFATELPPIESAASAQVSTQHGTTNRVQRIVNGVETSDYSAVGIVNGGCTGTLIAPNAVLTAAHCVEGAVSGMDFEVGGKTYKVDQVYIHPDYQSDDIDLAVMTLSENVTGVEPMDINRVAPQVGQTLTLVGFGATGTPRGGHEGDFGVKHVGETPIDDLETNHILWDFDNASESNTAPGDSGGPAFITVNGQQVIAGVTSGGSQENAGLGDQSYDTRVDTFADWIDSAVAGTAENVGGGAVDPVYEGGDEHDGDNDFGDDFNASDAEELARDELAEFDTNGDGSLSEGELTAELESYGYTAEEAREEAGFLVSDYDADRNGMLDLAELTESWGGELTNDGLEETDEDMVDEHHDEIDDESYEDQGQFEDDVDGEFEDDEFEEGESVAELAEEELTTFDANNDGELSAQELGVALESYGYDTGEAEEESAYLVEDFDTDGNGQLNLDELVESYGGESTAEDSFTSDDEFEDGELDEDSDVDSDVGDYDTDEGWFADDESDLDNGFEDFGEYDDEHDGCDVNGDGEMSPMDALMVVNFLNRDSGDMISELDVNGDGHVSPIDALMVINRMNTSAGRSAMPVQVDGIGGGHEADEEGESVDFVFAEYSTSSVF